MLFEGGIHVSEYDAQLLQILTYLVIYCFRIKLRAGAREKIAFGFRYSEPVKGALYALRQLVPVLHLAFRRFEVVKYVLEVYRTEIGSPFRHRLFPKLRKGLEPEIEHPRRLFLHRRYLANYVFAEALLRLEYVFLGHMEAVLVIDR